MAKYCAPSAKNPLRSACGSGGKHPNLTTHLPAVTCKRCYDRYSRRLARAGQLPAEPVVVDTAPEPTETPVVVDTAPEPTETPVVSMPAPKPKETPVVSLPAPKPKGRGKKSKWAGQSFVYVCKENPRMPDTHGWVAYEWMAKNGGFTYESYRENFTANHLRFAVRNDHVRLV